MRFGSDGGTVVTGVAPDRQRQDVRSSRTAKTHMRPPMAVPASAEIEEPLWPDLRNMEGQEGFSLNRACSKVGWMSAARARRLRPRKMLLKPWKYQHLRKKCCCGCSLVVARAKALQPQQPFLFLLFNYFSYFFKFKFYF